ncbi:MAG: RNA pseudouridine synthase [Saprospiraceae bacterium]|nr:RNA pseudouridine synthase [Saprospiraceae bacterium]MCF8250442.1 RNA pseudouridine synthase [Saprospiraceae bacterium]MCF8282117.1 RNA pseudouridine synthase [Bacteroidales bacterium]MCF8312412.1 RNA pseudouridine synthase [Saprospiraceae bacterium]MCF8440591.1 RNA pseudouridine synthase [Saprospiraceae bacterium]
MKILFEDNHLIAVNKPNNVLVQGDETGDETLADQVKKYIKDKYEKPGDVYLGIIHRLDRPVSGVTIFARTSKALERMNKIFAEREVKKTYWAVVGRRPEPFNGHLTHYILKDTSKNVVKAYDTMSSRAKGAKQADLDYELIAEIGDCCLLKVDLQTGRSHQIRAQLAKIGCPIRGDVKYGFPEPNKDSSIHLHCKNISFEHPVKKELVNLTASVPKDQVWKMFQAIDSD